MIVEIEKPRSSCRPSLDYNEGKVLRGVAELVGYANMASADSASVYALFDRYANGAVYPTAERSFHASVNPSEADGCSEEQVLQFITALMDHLGYGAQPYLVYRHFDIEREHYHVVSVRIAADGRKINNYYEKRRASAFMRENAPRFGFSVVQKGERVRTAADLSAGDAAGRAVRFDPRKGVCDQMKALCARALSYSFGSFAQLSCILEDLGVRASLDDRGAPVKVVLQGLDRKGGPATELISEEDLGIPLHDRALAAIQADRSTRAVKAREKERVRSLAGFAFGISRSEGHFVNILRNKGISVHLHRTSDSREIFGATFVDHVTRTVFKASEIRSALSVGMMREAVSSGKWRVEERGRQRSSYVRQARGSAREDALRLRDLRAGALARVLAPAGGRRGASWSGRTPPDRDARRTVADGERAGAMDVSFEDRRYEEKLR